MCPTTSRAEFGAKTPGSEVARVFADQIRGRKILVTGVSPKGIGASTAYNIASQKPGLLILASRTRSRIQQVVANIVKDYPDVRVEIVLLDLGSQKSIRQAAIDIAALTDELNILINNAGIVVTSRQATPEGIEQQFGTNHIGPFLFTNLLLPLLRNAAKTSPPGATRIVSLTSAGHRLSPIRFSDYNFEGKPVPPEEDHFKPLAGAFAKCAPDGYNGIVTYAQSKTANILFTLYLQKHLSKFGIAAYTLHPGSIETDLSRDQDAELTAQFYKVAPYWKSPDEGTSTTLVAALDPALNDIKGLYLSDCQFVEPFAHAKDPVAAKRLWKLSEELVGEKFSLEV
ncbi:Short-chain dehydrogenase TIC 32, chloroplastic [Madurella mycetomatis]|uniref:Short-chain dehydrogenase TIC 32, chloroplastic n=1 Tax=Madurella mycetomatis TaxID=100816 RepID=A0A175VVS7_9PEZI|nr:Short-chain dehydrogenase TIC 32, chloroplastic [Madurella mycetomatis]KXX79325.1 Short-chain dehydrogenase TIC 32, chloroplastic [Madurella mycetomatis]